MEKKHRTEATVNTEIGKLETRFAWQNLRLGHLLNFAKAKIKIGTLDQRPRNPP